MNKALGAFSDLSEGFFSLFKMPENGVTRTTIESTLDGDPGSHRRDIVNTTDPCQSQPLRVVITPEVVIKEPSRIFADIVLESLKLFVVDA